MWIPAVLSLLFAVPLTAPFGDAEATALVVNADGSAVLEVTVEVSGAPAAVLVRGVGLVDELPPVALGPQGDGTYSGIVELRTIDGVLLGFEYIPSGGGATTVTDLFTLVELGVDPAALARAAPVAPDAAATSIVADPDGAEEPDDGGRESSWAWLAVVSGAAFIGLAVLWIRMGRIVRVDKSSANADNSTNVDQESDAVSAESEPS
jgi:hypothetical protein